MHNKLPSQCRSSVLVASVGPGLSPLLDADFAAYSHRYAESRREALINAASLLEIVSSQFQIVHLLCRISADGLIIDEEDSKVPFAKVLDETYRRGTKALFLACDNPREAYVNGVKLSGKKMNVIMTLDRRGKAFTAFLFTLLSNLAEGRSMVQSWIKTVPPTDSSSELPTCIFAAGLPGALFLP